MRWLERDFLWPLAWACLPLALVADLSFGQGPEESARRYLQATAYVAAGDWAGARVRLEQAALADPEAPLPAHNMAIVWRELGDPERALHWNAETLERAPGFGPARVLRKVLQEEVSRTREFGETAPQQLR